MEKDRWPELCKLVEKDDGLPTRPAGHWTEDKLYFWNYYLHITTMAMVGSPAWPGGLVYVDLFGGPGICTLKSNLRMPGSPLIAANARKPFAKIIVCEKDEELAKACESRLLATPAGGRCAVLRGDCNELVHQVVKMIPDRAFNAALRERAADLRQQRRECRPPMPSWRVARPFVPTRGRTTLPSGSASSPRAPGTFRGCLPVWRFPERAPKSETLIT